MYKRQDRFARGSLTEGLGDDLKELVMGFPTVQQVSTFPVVWSGLVIKTDASHFLAKRKRATHLAHLARDFAGEYDLEFPTGGSFMKNPRTAKYRRLKEALLVGDVDEARKLKDRMLEGLQGTKRKQRLTGIRNSVRQNQPLDAFGVSSKKEKNEFKRWLTRRRGPAKAAELMQVQNEYVRSARVVGLN